jgi:hypothetical protein
MHSPGETCVWRNSAQDRLADSRNPLKLFERAERPVFISIGNDSGS